MYEGDSCFSAIHYFPQLSSQFCFRPIIEERRSRWHLVAFLSRCAMHCSLNLRVMLLAAHCSIQFSFLVLAFSLCCVTKNLLGLAISVSQWCRKDLLRQTLPSLSKYGIIFRKKELQQTPDSLEMLMLLLTAGLALANGATTVSVQHSAASGTVEMRHCAYQMYATTKVRAPSSL